MSEVVTVLMPRIEDRSKFAIRYRGLETQLGQLGVKPTFAESHTSYRPETHDFGHYFSTNGTPTFAVNPEDIRAVRDLTIPSDFHRPLYSDSEAPPLVHKPELNMFLRSKARVFESMPGLHPETIVVPSSKVMEAASAICGSNVVVKPASGSGSKGVYIGPLSGMPDSLDPGQYLVQEFIDTSGGIPELGIRGVHNLRLISVDSKIIGAIGRLPGQEGVVLRDDIYGKVYLPEELPDSMIKIADSVHNVLRGLPGEGKNVIAVDLMRGVNSTGNEVDVICEINHRPLRISDYDLITTQDDPKGVKWLAQQWDFAEANLLVNVAVSNSNDSKAGLAQ